MVEGHMHVWNKLEIGPPKKFRCSVTGCEETKLVHEPKAEEPEKPAEGSGSDQK